MSKFNLYLWTRLDNVKEALAGLIFLSTLAATLSGIACGLCVKAHSVEIAYNVLIISVIVGVMVTLLQILTPTSKDVALICGLETLTNNKELAKLPDNVIKATNNYLKGLQPKPKEDK